VFQKNAGKVLEKTQSELRSDRVEQESGGLKIMGEGNDKGG